MGKGSDQNGNPSNNSSNSRSNFVERIARGLRNQAEEKRQEAQEIRENWINGAQNQYREIGLPVPSREELGQRFDKRTQEKLEEKNAQRQGTNFFQNQENNRKDGPDAGLAA